MSETLDIGGLVPSIDDRDPQVMFEEWLDRVVLALPEYAPTNGSLDVIIAEALVTACADVIYAVNRLPGVVLQAVLALMDIPRGEGSSAEGDIEILLDGTRSVVVPSGSRFDIGGVEFVASQPAGAVGDRVAVHVIAAAPGTAGNLFPPGTAVDLLDPVLGAVGAQTTTQMTGGTEAEDDSAYLARAALVLQRMTSALVLPSAFEAYVAGQVDVARAMVQDLHEPGQTGDRPGHVTVWVLGRSGDLPAARLDALRADLQARAAAHLTVHVANVTTTDIPVALSVKVGQHAEAAAVLAEVEAAIEAAVSPTAWRWGDPVLPQEISAAAARVAGVDYVATVTQPTGPVALTPGSLPRARPVHATAAP